MRNILITLPFVIVLVLLFIWLIKALASGRGEVDRRDKFEQAGYETVRQTRAKEYSVIGISALVIMACIGIMGYIAWQMFQAGASAGPADIEHSLEIILIFIPAIILLTFVAVASRRYIKRQELILHEFNEFKSKRHAALREYEEKRRGRGTENADGTPVVVKQRVDLTKPKEIKQTKRGPRR